MPKYQATIETDEPLGQFVDVSLEMFLNREEDGVSVEVEQVE